MGYVTVAKLADVPAGTAKAVTVGDRDIAICNADGRICAIDNICTHDYGELNEGEMEGFEIECPVHGARFDVRTGRGDGSPRLHGSRYFPGQGRGRRDTGRCLKRVLRCLTSSR